MDELCAVVALSQSLVVWLGERYSAGLEIPQHKAWTIRENKWRAARYGLEADIIRDEEGNLMSLRRSLSDLVEQLEPTAERLGCLGDLQRVNEILERGTSAVRQREVFLAEHDLSAVVDSLVEEMKTGKPLPSPNGDLVGGTVVHGSPLSGEHP
jgi:carboxylate-amine ligase